MNYQTPKQKPDLDDLVVPICLAVVALVVLGITLFVFY